MNHTAPTRKTKSTSNRIIQNPQPGRRSLRGYAFDPQLSTQLESAEINEIVYNIPWESNLELGPRGEYLDVIDYDPASGGFYQPIDLDDKLLLAQNGLPPSEGNPQFHQQMVYAVSMSTIERFEHALGRRVLWSPRMRGPDDSDYVGQLRIYPHALRQQNAYYDPQRKALLFGYFPAAASDTGSIYPGGIVFTCLSQDIVAHETTHAILDGLDRTLLKASNHDALALHEGFADLVALFQHFSLADVLKQQIGKARGDLRTRNLLCELAFQFGQATGRYGALRSAIGQVDPETKVWKPLEPDPTALMKTQEVHARGAILVAAVFDAFLKIYERRTADLIRIATGGSGVFPAGALHPDLVSRLAGEAAKSATHMLTMCIRAIDYCPPVDMTFGDYLRALITADLEIVPEDELNYRIAVMEAFRARGIYPKGLRSLSVAQLVWDKPADIVQQLGEPQFGKRLRPFVDEFTYLDQDVSAGVRSAIFTHLHDWRSQVHDGIKQFLLALSSSQRNDLAAALGLDLSAKDVRFEVRSLQFARKASPTCVSSPQVLISIVQERKEQLNDQSFMFSGGCTIVIDPRSGEVQYVICKNINSASRLEEERAFHLNSRVGLVGLYLGAVNETYPSRQLANLHGFETEINYG